MPWSAVPVVAILGLAIGFAVGKMPCWKSWQGYVGLVIVAALVYMMGLSIVEIVVDCAALAAGFYLARGAGATGALANTLVCVAAALFCRAPECREVNAIGPGAFEN